MASTTRSKHHKAHLTAAISCNEIQIYPINANVKTASPLMTVNVSHINLISDSLAALAVSTLLDALDQKVEQALELNRKVEHG